MKISHNPQFRRDLIKLACLISAIAGTLAIFIVTPSLSSPTLLSVIVTMLLSPWVSALERRGCSRTLAISAIFLVLGGSSVLFGVWGIQSGQTEWSSFKTKAPQHFLAAIQKVRNLETDLKSHYPFLNTVHPTERVLHWGRETGQWFVDNGAALMGKFLTWIFIIPPLSFVLLSEGRAIRRRFFQLVPNRFFESFFLITTNITTAISDYIRAKLIEAILVGLMVTIGLTICKAPYAILLGGFAGITNIIPYVGPILGAVPGLLLSGFDPHLGGSILAIFLVYLIANILDTVLIFPLVVANLVNLHPLILIAIVAVGEHYYGLIGMLISIPFATALKVVLQEIYIAVYEQKVTRP